jgi:adenylate kinase family enzyme
MRVAISGKPYAGKSTLAKELAKKYGGHVLSIATPLKAQIPHINKVSDRAQIHEYANAMTANNPEVFISQLDLSGGDCIIIDDLRYLHEAHYLRSRGFMLIRLDTPRAICIERFAAALGRDPTAEEVDITFNSPNESQLDNFADWNKIEL